MAKDTSKLTKSKLTKDEKSVLQLFVDTIHYLDDLGTPEIQGMNLDGVRVQSSSKHDLGGRTRKYRNLRRRLVDRVFSELQGTINKIDGQEIQYESLRCRKKDCKLKDRRQKDSKFCRECGEQLT